MSPELQIIATFVLFLVLLTCGMAVPFAIAVPAIFYLLLQGGLPSLNSLGLVSWGLARRDRAGALAAAAGAAFLMRDVADRPLRQVVGIGAGQRAKPGTNDTHSGGGRKMTSCLAERATTSGGFCSFMP